MMGRAVALSIMMAAMLQAQEISPGYRAEIKTWQQDREAGLRSDSGWLTLAGLFWLQPGKNTIGSGETSDFLLPKHAPPQIGVLEVDGTVDGTEVTFRNLAGDQVTVNRKPVSSPVVLNHSSDDDGDVVQSGSISFFVIERGGKLAVRVKDRESQMLKNFKGTEFFPINPEFGLKHGSRHRPQRYRSQTSWVGQRCRTAPEWWISIIGDKHISSGR